MRSKHKIGTYQIAWLHVLHNEAETNVVLMGILIYISSLMKLQKL